MRPTTLRMAPVIVSVAIAMLTTPAAMAQRREYIVGGGGTPWREVAEWSIALNDTTVPGAIQPKELKPWENLLAGPDPGTNILGFAWHFEKYNLEKQGHVLGLNPRVWGPWAPLMNLLDGNESTGTGLRKLVHYRDWDPYGNGGSKGFIVSNEVYTLDLGVPLPADRVRFFPRQEGVDVRGVPYSRHVPRAFEVSVALRPQPYLLLEIEPWPFRPLERMVASNLSNSARIVDVEFPLQPIRFIRLDFSLRPQTYSLAEIQAYGGGFLPQCEYTSRLIDLGEPVSFGRIAFGLVPVRRREDGSLVEDRAAPVQFLLETRTGRDDTPLVYYVVDEVGRDVEVTKEEYDRAKAPLSSRPGLRFPGRRSAVVEDRENWTPWSSPYRTSGQANRSADSRRYLQFRFRLESDEVWCFGRLDSLSFEYSPLLAQEVVGEVSLAADPARQTVEVAAGVDQLFACDVRAVFGETTDGGFDGLRLSVPEYGRFVRLEMGDPLLEVTPDRVEEEGGQVTVYFPAHRIDASRNAALRLTVAATLLTASHVFQGEVFDSESDNLPQSLEAGDAHPGVHSNSLQVYSEAVPVPVLFGLTALPGILTPNGDGVNDRIQIRYTLMGVESTWAVIEIRDLAGRPVCELLSAWQLRGHHQVMWDGCVAGGRLAPPGTYICQVAVETESGRVERAKLVSVAY